MLEELQDPGVQVQVLEAVLPSYCPDHCTLDGARYAASIAREIVARLPTAKVDAMVPQS